MLAELLKHKYDTTQYFQFGFCETILPFVNFSVGDKNKEILAKRPEFIDLLLDTIMIVERKQELIARVSINLELAKRSAAKVTKRIIIR